MTCIKIAAIIESSSEVGRRRCAMDKKTFKKQWTNFLIDAELKNVDIAKAVGITKQSLGKKINNCSIRYIDLANIVEKYGYSIDIHKK